MTSERKFIEESVKRVLLKEYLKRKTERSGFGGLDIQRTPMGTRVTLIAERPGMVIGRKGETIKELTEHVENEFQFDNPQIEVKEVSNPNLNPHIMAQKLANALERGWHFRRAGHSTVRRIMSAGAKGCQVIISGKLTGQRHRTEKFREGHIKYCGETKLIWMHEGYAVAKKKLGVIGVKVQIMDPNAKLPDEIELRELKDVAEIKTIPEDVEMSADVKAEVEVEGEPGSEQKTSEEQTEEKRAAEETKDVKKDGKKKAGKKKAEEEDLKEQPAEPAEPAEAVEPAESTEPETDAEIEAGTEPTPELEPAPDPAPEQDLEQATKPVTDVELAGDVVTAEKEPVTVEEQTDSKTSKTEKDEDDENQD